LKNIKAMKTLLKDYNDDPKEIIKIMRENGIVTLN
jgi:hypothetical protein